MTGEILVVNFIRGQTVSDLQYQCSAAFVLQLVICIFMTVSRNNSNIFIATHIVEDIVNRLFCYDDEAIYGGL